jgi:hypothetical protein
VTTDELFYTIEITLSPDNDPNELAALLPVEAGARTITSKGFSGVAELILVATGSVTTITGCFEWVRARWHRQAIIDLRNGKVRIYEQDGRTGRTIVIAPDGTVTNYEPGGANGKPPDLGGVISSILARKP